MKSSFVKSRIGNVGCALKRVKDSCYLVECIGENNKVFKCDTLVINNANYSKGNRAFADEMGGRNNG